MPVREIDLYCESLRDAGARTSLIAAMARPNAFVALGLPKALWLCPPGPSLPTR